MIKFYQLSLNLQAAFGTISLLLMIPAVFILAASFLFRLRKSDKCEAVIVSAFVIGIMQGINDLHTQIRFNRQFTLPAKIVGNMPVNVLIFLLLVLAAGEVMLIFTLLHRWSHMLNSNVIKESLDALPDGICIFDSDGQPLLVNTQMNRLSGELFDTGILNAEIFWQRLKDWKIDGHNVVVPGDSNVIVRTKDEKVWNVSRNILKTRGCSVNELVANDITEQYDLSLELERRNRRLADINERLRLYSLEVERIIIEKEILAAKMRVHDDIGRSLLAFRSYLEQDEHDRSREKLLSLWRYTIKVMKHEASHVKEVNDWDKLMEAAKAVDVAIEMKGNLPDDKKNRGLIMAALHECLTNTVKHAKGNRLYINITAGENELAAELSNNGNPPKGEIQENGGLKNLRHAVEASRGIMDIKSKPQFVMRLTLPKGEDNSGKSESDDSR